MCITALRVFTYLCSSVHSSTVSATIIVCVQKLGDQSWSTQRLYTFDDRPTSSLHAGVNMSVNKDVKRYCNTRKEQMVHLISCRLNVSYSN